MSIIRPGHAGIPTLWESVAHGPALIVPVVIATAVVAAAGAGYSAYSSSQAAAYQSQVAKNNATIAAENQNYSESVGLQQEQEQAIQNRATVGGIITSSAASGLDVNSGSAVNLQASGAMMGDLSDLNIRDNTARAAFGYNAQGMAFGAQSQLDTSQSGSDLIGGGLTAAGDLGSGIGKAGSLYKMMQTTGATNPNPPSLVN